MVEKIFSRVEWARGLTSLRCEFFHHKRVIRVLINKKDNLINKF